MKRSAYKELNAWKLQQNRLPLLIRGARQVGKSYLVRAFGQNEFKNYLEINFELQPELKGIFETLDAKEICKQLSLSLGHQISPGQTLIFFDEIQECPAAVSALRYFYEQVPEQHVIAAGSLLEFKLRAKEIKVPVGRAQYFFLGPLSFEEFLDAINESELRNFLQEFDLQTKTSEALHLKFIKLLKTFCAVGGMPAVLAKYLEEQNLFSVLPISTSLLYSYRDDFGKYANLAQHKYLEKVFLTAPAMIAKQYTYSKVDPDTPSRELKNALDLLSKAGILHRVHSTSGQGLPFEAQANQKRFKIYFLDIGLVASSLGLASELILAKDFIAVNSGAMSEQFVAQELLAYENVYRKKKLFYWAREKKQSSAEVDFLIAHGSNVIPIEVKSSSPGNLRSLREFMNEHKSKHGIRISQLPLAIDGKLLSIPAYAIGQVGRILDSL